MHVEPIERPQVVVTPLRKRDATGGNIYTRMPSVERKLKELLTLPRKQVILLCEIQNHKDTNYVPTECLVYLVRACRDESANSYYFESLYNALLERMIRRLPSAESKDRKTIVLQETLIQEGVLDRFREMLAMDRNVYESRLDFYEVRFDMTLKRSKMTVQREVWSEVNRSSPLESPDTGEIAAHVEEAAGMFDPFNVEGPLGKDYRLRLPAAIDSLTVKQRRIVTMYSMGIPFDSKDPKVLTISNALKLSDKTVRTEKQKAFAKLKHILEKGDAE